jgi:arginine:pyruvate transaminase
MGQPDACPGGHAVTADPGSWMPAGPPAAASSMTLAEEGAYLDPRSVKLDAGAGYPTIGFGPPWIEEIRKNPPPGFLDRQRVPGWLRIIREKYFAKRFFTSPDNILLTRSCTDAFTLAARAVIRDPFDEVIVIDTSFEPYPKLLEDMFARPVYARRVGAGIPDPRSIADACTDRTRAVVLINPDNPLGVITPRPVMNEIADLCRQRDITLICDYALCEANPWGQDIPLVHQLPSSSGLKYMLLLDTSKFVGLAGAKLGAVMHPGGELGERLHAARSLRHYEFDALQLATIAAVMDNAFWSPYQHHVRLQIAANYDYLQAQIEAPLRLEPMAAGCFALVDVSETGMTGEEFARLLHDEHSTLVIPVSDFPTGHPGPRPDTRIRLALTRDGEFNALLAKTLNEAAQ